MLSVWFRYLWYCASLEQWCKQPTRCNKFRLLIFLNQLYMFRVKNSPILRSTFWLYIQFLVRCTDIAADRWQDCHWSAAILVHCTKSCIYSQKVLLRMGEFSAQNMYGWFKKINKQNLLHLVGCLHCCVLDLWLLLLNFPFLPVGWSYKNTPRIFLYLLMVFQGPGRIDLAFICSGVFLSFWFHCWT